MSSSVPCTPCCTTPQVTNVPGLEGLPGGNGTNGVNAYSVTTADFVVPALNANVTVAVASAVAFVIGQVLIVGQGIGTVLANPGPATFQVVALPGPTSITLKYLQASGDVATGATISTGAIVAPSGQPQPSPIGISAGGTGQTTAAAALRALGARRKLLAVLLGANFNSTADQAMVVASSKYIVNQVFIENASVNMTTAAGGIYTAPAKGGVVIVAAATVYTSLTTTAKFKSAALDATAGGPTTDVMTAGTLYLSLTTGQGAPATADVYIFGDDLT